MYCIHCNLTGLLIQGQLPNTVLCIELNRGRFILNASFDIVNNLHLHILAYCQITSKIMEHLLDTIID
ncbi:hypothetical protein RIF29_13677 [Crotalaria pallida]|uniref:Uncharacterized protein n=1 Tax=Crotalaria pallida TaxID=3830 RepID=A0AAN9IPM1_CROPI